MGWEIRWPVEAKPVEEKPHGGKTLLRKNPVEAKPRQVALLTALLTSGFRNGAKSQKYPHRSAFLSNFI